VVTSPFFADMAAGTLSMARFRFGLLHFFPLIEAFPKYIALLLTKLPLQGEPAEAARDWLIQNLGVERRHVVWYRQWAVDFGVRAGDLLANKPPPEIDAVNNHLWRVATYGAFAEGLAAINVGIEGPTGIWTKRVRPRIGAYGRRRGVTVRTGTLTWLNAHARYDDRHPDEALDLIAKFARSNADWRLATEAACRSMAYYAMAADAVYRLAK
jgi:pyrroloquinoline quinone (PQQ) biosynthesis protein C